MGLHEVAEWLPAFAFVNTIINREAGLCTLRIIQPTP
jgi:hypothetical protein